MKEYEYRIYDRSGTYVGNLTDVSTRHPEFSTDIMGGCGSLTITIARSRTDFCSCTDLIVGNEVMVVEKTGGVQIYSGYINQARSGQDTAGQESVTVEMLGYVSEFARMVLEDADGDTGLETFSSDPSDMFSDVIGLYDGKITEGTVQTSGVTASCRWNAVTIVDAINSIMDRLPNTWYWYVDGANHAHLKNTSGASVTHYLTVGREIGQLDVAVELDSVVNDVRVIGGTPSASEPLMGRYRNELSILSWGLSQKVISDGRLFDADSMAFVAASNMNPVPVGSATLDVWDNEESSRGYDIESIHPGDIIVVKDPAQIVSGGMWDSSNWDQSWFDAHPNDVFGIPMIVTRVEYRGDRARITTADRLAKGTKDLETVKRNLETFQKENAPVSTTI